MKARIEIESGSYGFGHTWTLIVETKNGIKAFYLGQDVKFCSRVLNMSPAYIVQQIGSGEITKPTINSKLAKFIIKSLNISSKQLNSLQPWELSAE